MLPYRPTLKPLARQLRRGMTDAERHLWAHLRGKQVAGLQFYRQKPLGGYIADFYCAAARLVIEIDGAQHGETDARAYDQLRTEVLEGLGLRVLRFDNRQVLMDAEGVMAVIREAVEIPEIPPGPPFSKGGVG